MIFEWMFIIVYELVLEWTPSYAGLGLYKNQPFLHKSDKN